MGETSDGWSTALVSAVGGGVGGANCRHPAHAPATRRAADAAPLTALAAPSGLPPGQRGRLQLLRHPQPFAAPSRSRRAGDRGDERDWALPAGLDMRIYQLPAAATPPQRTPLAGPRATRHSLDHVLITAAAARVSPTPRASSPRTCGPGARGWWPPRSAAPPGLPLPLPLPPPPPSPPRRDRCRAPPAPPAWQQSAAARSQRSASAPPSRRRPQGQPTAAGCPSGRLRQHSEPAAVSAVRPPARPAAAAGLAG